LSLIPTNILVPPSSNGVNGSEGLGANFAFDFDFDVGLVVALAVALAMKRFPSVIEPLPQIQ
jgi:hypothetical protein